MRNFYGNPNQVTVGGQSAGSVSALNVMRSPLARGRAHGVIAESGVQRATYMRTISLALLLRIARKEYFMDLRSCTHSTCIPYSDYSNVTCYDYDYVVERWMSEYWVNFIRKGNPNGDRLPNFIKTTNQTKETMWLGNSWGAGPLSIQDKRIDLIGRWYATLKEW